MRERTHSIYIATNDAEEAYINLKFVNNIVNVIGSPFQDAVATISRTTDKRWKILIIDTVPAYYNKMPEINSLKVYLEQLKEAGVILSSNVVTTTSEIPDMEL